MPRIVRKQKKIKNGKMPFKLPIVELHRQQNLKCRQNSPGPEILQKEHDYPTSGEFVERVWLNEASLAVV